MSATDFWMRVRGRGLGHTAAPSTEEALCVLSAPDLTALPELLAHYYGQSPPPPLRRVPRYARLGLVAALRALRQAGWEKDLHAPGIACIIGSAWGSVEMSMDYMDSLLDAGPRLSSPTAFSHAVNNMGAGLLSLFLQTRGACQTVAQFELSFAGALQAAALELGSGRTQRVLVGALDEADPRFTHACPEARSGTDAAHEGAVFLCLESAEPVAEPVAEAVPPGENRGAQLCVRWHGPEQTAPTGARLLLSGAAQHPQGHCLREHYGLGPLGQALDVSLALHLQTNCVCRCEDTVYGRQADVEVKYDAILES